MTLHRHLAAPGCGCDGRDLTSSLISIDEALGLIAAHVAPVGDVAAVPLQGARGRVLAQPVRCRSMAPAFDNAAMDGYAVATSAMEGSGPWALRVEARVPAGQDATAPLSGGSAARIFTGAPIPEGADAVVMQEDVARQGDVVHLRRRPAPGLNVRRAGSDMPAGAELLAAGERLGPREIAACAAAGAGVVRVRRRPRVALLVTGDEVRRAGGASGNAQIWDVNTPMLTADLEAAHVDLVAVDHGVDSRPDLLRQMRDMEALADLIVTTGGVSVGEEDHVKPAFAALGGETLFSGVAIKPGKPVCFGRLGAVHWLGLPGNPLSAFVTWRVFGVALLRRLAGETARPARRRIVVAAEEIRRKPGRCELRPARIVGADAQGREVVRLEPTTRSGWVGGLPASDGLAFLPAEADHLSAGALVEFLAHGDA